VSVSSGTSSKGRKTVVVVVVSDGFNSAMCQ